MTPKFLSSEFWRPFVFRALSYSKFRRFEQETKDVARVQEASWLRISNLLKNSEYWNSSKRGSTHLKDFPITSFEDYRECLDNALNSKFSPLNGEEIDYWATSSGSTAQQKVFPITPSYRKEFQSVVQPFIHGMCSRFRGFFSKPLAFVVSTCPRDVLESGKTVGSISYFNYASLPKFVRDMYALPLELLNQPDLYEKWLTYYFVSQDFSAMAAITPQILLTILKNIKKDHQFLRDVIEGSIPFPNSLSAVKMDAARKKLVLDYLDSKVEICDLWPGLECIITWKASVCAEPARRLSEVFQNKIPVVDGMYSATEGWVTVPLSNDRNGGPVHPGGHVYEFIENGQEIRPGNLLPLHKLEEGKDYEIFLTTSMGFVRYRLFDIVRCTGHYNQSPNLVFLRKSGQILRCGQLALSDEQVFHITNSLDWENLFDGDYWIFSVDKKQDKLLFLSSKTTSDALEFVEQFDECLQKENRVYKMYRKSGAMEAIRCLHFDQESHIWDSKKHQQSKPKAVSVELPDCVLENRTGDSYYEQ